MTDLKLSNRRQPIVTYPSDMFKKHYAGKLVGYYVEDTNFYNVMPNDIAYDNNKCRELFNYCSVSQHLLRPLFVLSIWGIREHKMYSSEGLVA